MTIYLLELWLGLRHGCDSSRASEDFRREHRAVEGQGRGLKPDECAAEEYGLLCRLRVEISNFVAVTPLPRRVKSASSSGLFGTRVRPL